MRFLRGLGKFFWRFMVIFSFIVNIILVIVLLVLGLLIFDIKSNIAQPLVNGLHSSFVGLDQATIDWTIPVRDEIQVVLDIPLETETIVRLTQPVPLQVNALIDLPGINAYNVTATVNLQLPQGLELPVALDLDVAVNQPLPIALDVRAVIPLNQTQLHDPFENLRLLFEPFARSLYNLPSNFGQAISYAGDVLAGRNENLLNPNPYSDNPWPGFSRTAGLGYRLISETQTLNTIDDQGDIRPTGIIPLGGIRALDEQLRPDVYAQGGPAVINTQAVDAMRTRGVPINTFTGQEGDTPPTMDTGGTTTGTEPGTATGGPFTPPVQSEDLGIIPTPTGGEG